MSDEISPQEQGRPQVVVVGPDGIAVGGGPEGPDSSEAERPITEMVEQPAKVMRIGSMIRQLLDEVKSAPLDEKSRARLKEIHQNSIKELEDGLAPELVDELERLSLPFADDTTPSEAELRPGAARGLARRTLPRHPDHAVRAADGGPRATRADAPRAPPRAHAVGRSGAAAAALGSVPLTA